MIGHYVQKIAANLQEPESALNRYLTIGSFALIEVLAVFALQWFLSARLHAHWNVTYTLEIFQRQLVAGLLPVPIAFLLWLRVLEQEGAFQLRYSPVMGGTSIIGFAAMFFLYSHPYCMLLALAIGVIAGLFAYIPFAGWVRRAVRHPRLACVALIAATASMDYYWLMEHSPSQTLLFWSGAAVSHVLDTFGIDIYMTDSLEFTPGYSLYSSHYMANLVPFCCGFEGIFLFFFVLSAALLTNWDRLKDRRLWPLYGLGAILIFIANVLRIVVIFSIGNWANTPGAPGWVQSLKATPLEMVHSWIAWIFYQIIFAMFAIWLCKRSSKNEHPSTPA